MTQASKAHALAREAEVFVARNRLALARESHLKAAEAFQAASIECADDPSLAANLASFARGHAFQARVLEHRISKSAEAAAAAKAAPAPAASDATQSNDPTFLKEELRRSMASVASLRALLTSRMGVSAADIDAALAAAPAGVYQPSIPLGLPKRLPALPPAPASAPANAPGSTTAPVPLPAAAAATAGPSSLPPATLAPITSSAAQSAATAAAPASMATSGSESPYEPLALSTGE
eukprot:m.223508 g.223508  ORF g.223508 m.223508 type:complete len:236 (+) comp16265_c0_seq1:1045-1752(+)